MIEVVFAKLEQFTPLTAEDKDALRAAVTTIEAFAPRQDIVSEGARPDGVHLLLEGWAGRYKTLEDGARHTMAFLIPGDLCDVQITLLDVMDHSIGALSSCRVATFGRETLATLMGENERLGAALMWATLVDEAILREWLVNLGGRKADRRLAHLLCEMLLRTQAVGQSANGKFEVPLTQEQLADSLGMSPVHVNRTLQDLRARQLIRWEGKHVRIEDVEQLMAFAGFDPTYLHQVRSRTDRCDD